MIGAMGHLEDRAGLDGKVALIAGGGGGLGRAVALDFARAGMRLVLCDRNETLLERTADDTAAAGVAPLTAVIDVRDADALATAFTDGIERFGGLDVVVNVAGGTFKADFVDTNPRGWDALIRANFSWLLLSTQLAAQQMRAQGRGGSIINLTSIEAHRAAPGYAVYSAMKGAVVQLARTLAVELAPDGIRINNIAPDQVPTEGMSMMGLNVDPARGRVYEPGGPEHQAVIRAGIPMGRQGTYEDVGGCALFLASDLSAYVTGTTLHPDGGALASAGWFNWPGLGFLNMPPVSAFATTD
jgi:NAD(P)-dependent dehydrogenase (short-subunit alcohol dehydrogenase family)